MSRNDLATYLNDHLAGSTIALEMLEHMQSAYADTEAAHLASGLYDDVSADRGDLERLMTHLDIKQSTVRKASAWLSEKMTRLKLQIDDPSARMLRLLEALDLVSTGIEGKRLLWIALAEATKVESALAFLDYARLQQRAAEQRSRLEGLRLQAARQSLPANS